MYGGADAEIAGMAQDDGARPLGERARVVFGAVVDDDDVAVEMLAHREDDAGDGAGFVERRNDQERPHERKNTRDR
jgi:hypothetical protein